jgi:hypothetical protein
MMTWKFKGIIVLCVGQQRHLAQPLSPVQKAFLRVLQVPKLILLIRLVPVKAGE